MLYHAQHLAQKPVRTALVQPLQALCHGIESPAQVQLGVLEWRSVANRAGIPGATVSSEEELERVDGVSTNWWCDET